MTYVVAEPCIDVLDRACVQQPGCTLEALEDAAVLLTAAQRA